jgi:Zn-dependent M28 family amino/carboxypeptidase
MDTAVKTAADCINADAMLNHIKILASDEFEGRLPGSVGEEKTVEYLQKQCESLGLKAGGENGSYLQKVPVYSLKAQPELEFRSKNKEIKLSSPDDFVALSRNLSGDVSVANSEVVFVGYGVRAPEYKWDDYKGVDVRGKTVIMLIGDPTRPDPKDPNKLDDSFFRGKALTYYGRWTYKYEIASELGAAAVLIVHETEPAGYGYDVVTASWGQENFDLGTSKDRVDMEGWLSLESARKLFEMSGVSFDDAKKKAQKQDFVPISLNVKSNAKVKSATRKFETSNVVAVLPGSDPALKDECIVYSAHWDHFGTKKNTDGTIGVFSGALDNGSGVATVLEIARAYGKLQEPPKRSIVFLFTTLEERGLLGSLYYVQSPLVPLAKTLAVINVDVMNVWGRARELVSIAKGHSSLDDVLSKFAEQQGRTVIADPESEKGYFYRSDHLEFIRKGVPALFFLYPGSSYIGKPEDYGMQKRLAYVKNDYHKVSDKVKDDWDLSGAVEDAQLLFQVGLDVANGSTKPRWNATSEFNK